MKSSPMLVSGSAAPMQNELDVSVFGMLEMIRNVGRRVRLADSIGC